MDVYVIGWRFEEELVNWNWNPEQKGKKRTGAASSRRSAKTATKRQQKSTGVQKLSPGQGEQFYPWDSSIDPVVEADDGALRDVVQADDGVLHDTEGFLGSEEPQDAWRDMLTDPGTCAVRERGVAEEMPSNATEERQKTETGVSCVRTGGSFFLQHQSLL